MSVAFVREESAEATQEVSLPPRAISPHPNLVTQSGLRALGQALAESQQALKTAQVIEDITELTLADNRVIRILAGGHMVNLAGPRPMGNSIESMDLGFALQARCLEAVAFGRVGAVDCVVPSLERSTSRSRRPF